MLIRMRRMHGKQRVELVGVHKKTEKQDKKREEKAHRAAQLQDTIKHELLQRLREGTYGDLYDDIVNYNTKTFKKIMDEEEEEDLEFDWLEEKETKKDNKKSKNVSKGPQFVEAYSDEDDDDDDEEDEDVEYEYEYEREGLKQREKVRQSAMVEHDDVDDDDDDGDDYGDFEGEDLDYDYDEDDYEDEDELDEDDDDMEDQTPDFDLIKSKQLNFKNTQNSQPKTAVSQSNIKSAPVPVKNAAGKATGKAVMANVTTNKAVTAKRTNKGRGVDDL
jgi:protein MAK16